MTSAALPAPATFQPQRAAISLIASLGVAFGVFLSGFVINEPAPYEVYFAALIGIWAIFGLRLSRHIAPLIGLYIVFNIGGMFSILTMEEVNDTPMYMAVSLFLAFTAMFFAAIIEADHRRLRLIYRAYLAAAIITALLGILGYLGAIPGGEIFTRYGRAMGAFQDPNVFGPYLVLPALYLMHGLLTGTLKAAPLRAIGLTILVLGVFFSFSRAAWGLLAICMMLLVLTMLIKERTGAFRLKILIMTLIGSLLLVGAIIVALQFDQIADLFSDRAKLVQAYDGARLGRFERHAIGFLMAMEHPLGIGPLEFGLMWGEDTHNIWLKALMDYGWLGFVSYLVLITWTLVLGFRFLLRERPWQRYLMLAYIVLVGHTIIGSVIDTDHWRHFYLLMGIVWGCIALEMRWQSDLRR
ncbi:lipid A core-O-antigen ligase-like enyme [Hoeflea sp. IMCC20628]|uniref:O-antigen ligase family protein n=1 Tax=Hoeflea sp. IMCC20628 TaxID=1620421 RepID=UPI00063AEF27|nr:O-antigen ligase family protein [Hoeflea sp. IMCC20628]AKI01055.1 lipid A core-O-antigen ligase-like enyme [Hoeflea sp. IMCC20628]